MSLAFLTEARRSFHKALFDGNLLTYDHGIPSIADKHSRSSVAIAQKIMEKLGAKAAGARLVGQMSGSRFEEIVGQFLENTFPKMKSLRPGNFTVARGRNRLAIAQCDQYDHLTAVEEASRANPELAVALGQDYIIKPDVMLLRLPEDDGVINATETIVDQESGRRTSIRKLNNNSSPILHASVSCKWTLRSDRAQNARSEALNLVRNRKGRLPHIVVITAEPTPNRIASIALGTGDIDCVYHIALTEFIETVTELDFYDSRELLMTMVEGKRLRDIADLPLDLAI
jgi:hypothetical protein